MSDSTLAPLCLGRAVLIRDAHTAPTVATSDSAIIWRLSWDAPAAGEYPRPMLATAAAAAARWPDLALDIWHHAAGATILGQYCCGTPASHRDALADIARSLRVAVAS
jgi:hypothetical protein